MKHCTIYGCDAAAPRNSKVCFEHIKQGIWSNPIEVLVDRGAPSFTIRNNTDKTYEVHGIVFHTGDYRAGLYHPLLKTDAEKKLIDGLYFDAVEVSEDGTLEPAFPSGLLAYAY